MLRSFLSNSVLTFVIFMIFLTANKNVSAEEALCAVVKIEIAQELALERQAFEAKMKITNALDTIPLENVNINIIFKNSDGKLVEATSDSNNQTASFFIRVDSLFNIDAISGNGIIAPSSNAEIRWLIIPSAKAANEQHDGTLYFVGATLTFTFEGEEQTIEVTPDTIVVKPQPLLTLDYFLTKEVIGDDAFTPEIEPPVPYVLGVRIANNGAGIANNVKIDSAQPKIVENEQGLAVGFKIISSFLNEQPAQNSLLIDFGDIDSGGIANGRWNMETSLSGEFTSFTASFNHADELGGELTSLLQATNAHYLIHDVKVDASGRDNIKDFLALGNDLSLRVYESEPLGIETMECNDCSEVTDQSTSSTLGNAQIVSGSEQRVITTTPHAGFAYIKLPDPYSGSKAIVRAVRSDNKVLPIDNIWLSKSRAEDNTNFDHFINIFDFNTTSSYTLTFNEVVSAQPPTLSFIPNKITHEGGDLGFLIQASDPNGTTPTISIANAPTGALFTDEGTGQAVFQWFPSLGQAGQYDFTLTASDGALSSKQTVHITVNPANDRDGDGLDDQWEIIHFGDLNNDGEIDTDNDGLTDIAEFDISTDPNNPDTDGDEKNDGDDDIPLFNASWLNPVLILMLD